MCPCCDSLAQGQEKKKRFTTQPAEASEKWRRCRIGCVRLRHSGFYGRVMLQKQQRPEQELATAGKSWDAMYVNCEIVGCKMRVPQELEAERRCVLHFTLELEQACMQIRRETAVGTCARERFGEMRDYIVEHGAKLARLATGGAGLTDETKARILSTFLTLMNCRENIERIATRQDAERRIAG